MKRCLACNAHYPSSIVDCPTCGVGPTLVDGFYAYAPEFAHGGGGFKSDHFSALFCLEESNFWFRSRNQVILWAIKKYYPDFHSLLEIGCGTGYVLSGVAKEFPYKNLHGSEILRRDYVFLLHACLPLISYKWTHAASRMLMSLIP